MDCRLRAARHHVFGTAERDVGPSPERYKIAEGRAPAEQKIAVFIKRSGERGVMQPQASTFPPPAGHIAGPAAGRGLRTEKED
jgi:hypothetical protein